MTHVKALQLTASELFSRINTYMQDMQLRKIFRDAFELNAAVKFAKYMPATEESKNTLKEIIKSLYQIDDTVNRARINADRMVPKY
jgi:L-serine deaminase